jgi:hypothetical protein
MILLDTHTAIWLVGQPAKLSKNARAAIEKGMGLASNLGPLVAVKFGPFVAACWTR